MTAGFLSERPAGASTGADWSDTTEVAVVLGYN
jgi:hypothetical protein